MSNMASIFKRRKGKNEPYTIQYVDHLGKRRTTQAFTDKGLTEQLAAKLEMEARLRKTGMVDVEREKAAIAGTLLLAELIERFKENLAERSPQYRLHTISRLKKTVNGCGFSKLADISSEAVVIYLRGLRKTKNLGPRTFNHYLQAIDAFCNWCVFTKRLLANPLIGIERLNVELDVRHKRRALLPDEFGRLVQSARESSRRIQGFSGEQRARIYLISYFTGLRRQELGSLTPRSFDLVSNPSTVTIRAAASKHRKTDLLPLHPVLVESLPLWLKGSKLNAPLFPKLAQKKTWFMVKKDLERVGIPYETEDGIADFHAAGRHTHITELLRNGATLPEAQKLARHSDIRMTMKYTHIGLDDQALAVAKLPSNALQMRCISGGASGHQLALDDKDDVEQKRKNPCESKGFVVDRQFLTETDKVEDRGFEPAGVFDATDNFLCSCIICQERLAARALQKVCSKWLDLSSFDTNGTSGVASSCGGLR